MNTRQQILGLVKARRRSADGTGRSIRRASGLSLAEVAVVVGAAESTVSRWENARRVPHGPAAARWADLLAELESAGYAA